MYGRAVGRGTEFGGYKANRARNSVITGSFVTLAHFCERGGRGLKRGKKIGGGVRGLKGGVRGLKGGERVEGG